MVIKTAIALILTASLAGGAVFYGTQGDNGQNGEVSLGEHPHKKAADFDDTTSSINEALEGEDIEPAAPAEETTNISVINRLLNRSSEPAEDVPSEAVEEEVTTTTKTTITETVETVESAVDIDPDLETSTADVDETSEFSTSMVGSDNVFEFSLAQAARIETVAIRDQAYLDIIDYACRSKDYAGAQATTSKIERVQMRDKARGNIAISMAERGMADAAFAEVDKVETEGLQDTMRLQVLQALIRK